MESIPLSRQKLTEGIGVYYSFNSGRGILKLPYGEFPMRVENNMLVITTNKTDHGFIKLNDVDYVKFSGTYAMSEWNGMIPTY